MSELRSLARQRKARTETGRYVIEGIKLVDEAVAADVPLLAVFVDGDSLELSVLSDDASALADLVDLIEASGIEVFCLDPEVLDRVSSTSNPQPIVAVASGSTAPITDLGADVDFVLVAVDVNDPGNLGTLIRSAVASGADAVILAGNVVDVFNPKTVRSSAGALFQMPVFTSPDAESAVAALGARGVACVGTSGRATAACDAIDLTEPVAIVVGSEAHGLSTSVEDLMDHLISIPMPGPVESLNVAMAAAILCYETQRQRRTKNSSASVVAAP